MAALDSAGTRQPALDIPALAKETGATFLVVAALGVGLVGFKTVDVSGGIDIQTRWWSVFFAALFVANDDSGALRLANATSYGLGASVWTASPARAERMIRGIEAGSVFVNGLVKSDPRLPFGGVKASGFGRELSREGLLEFVNAKTVWIA